MDWTIEPYVGVGKLKFGMTPEEVAEILGPPTESRNPADLPGDIPELYEGKTDLEEFRVRKGEIGYSATEPTISYLRGFAVAFTFYEMHETLNYKGIPFFTGIPENNIQRLKEVSQDIVHTSGDYYIFLDLGIDMLDEELFDFSDPVNVFAKGDSDIFLKECLKDGTCEFIKGSSEGYF